jgi:hypothetical protein
MYFCFCFLPKNWNYPLQKKRTNLGFDESSIFIPQSYPQSEDVMTSKNTTNNVIAKLAKLANSSKPNRYQNNVKKGTVIN